MKGFIVNFTKHKVMKTVVKHIFINLLVLSNLIFCYEYKKNNHVINCIELADNQEVSSNKILCKIHLYFDTTNPTSYTSELDIQIFIENSIIKKHGDLIKIHEIEYILNDPKNKLKSTIEAKLKKINQQKCCTIL